MGGEPGLKGATVWAPGPPSLEQEDAERRRDGHRNHRGDDHRERDREHHRMQVARGQPAGEDDGCDDQQHDERRVANGSAQAGEGLDDGRLRRAAAVLRL